MRACNWRCLPCGPVEPPLVLEASQQGWRRCVRASMIPAASVGRPPNASGDENGRKSGRKRRREQGEGCDVKAHVSALSLELVYVALCEGRLLPNTWERAALPPRGPREAPVRPLAPSIHVHGFACCVAVLLVFADPGWADDLHSNPRLTCLSSTILGPQRGASGRA